jgi:hypothetical protein
LKHKRASHTDCLGKLLSCKLLLTLAADTLHDVMEIINGEPCKTLHFKEKEQPNVFST